MKLVCIGILLLVTSTVARGQKMIDSASFQRFFPFVVNQHVHTNHSGDFLDTQVGRLFRFYKVTFSAQDAQSCAFSPSCSTYSVEAIRAHGFFVGLCETFDRLTRCHTYSSKYYLRDKNGDHLIDSLTTDQ